MLKKVQVPQIPTIAIPIVGGVGLVLLLMFLENPFLAFLGGISSFAIAGALKIVKSAIPQKKRTYRNAFLICIALALSLSVLLVFGVESIPEGDDVTGIFLLIILGPPLIVSIITAPILGYYWLAQKDDAAGIKPQERNLRILLAALFLLAAVIIVL